MTRFVNVRRKEIMVMELDHEGADGFIYFRLNPGNWFYSDGGPNLTAVRNEDNIEEVEKLYSEALARK